MWKLCKENNSNSIKSAIMSKTTPLAINKPETEKALKALSKMPPLKNLLAT